MYAMCVDVANTDGESTWSLVDVTTGETKLSNQTNQHGDDIKN